MDKYLGKRLDGRYEIQECVGTGGMSNVYRALDLIDDRVVAVKILRDEFIDNSELLRRFKNESKAIAVLSHPNIVKVYDVSFNNRTHSIVMEYINGITLKDYIDQQGVLRWKEAVHFTLQILRALQHAHDKGIVHRDIKPQNIMMLPDGNIKVTDFGIARFARSESKTITDRAIGSVHYISPEQAMGDSTDEKSDIYSVGVMLFEMLTGKLPFEADSPVSVAIKQIQSQAVMPRSINPGIPEGLEEITIRAMLKDSSRRYQSAAEMIQDIEQFKMDPGIHFSYKYLEPEQSPAQRKKFQKAVEHSREEDSMYQKPKRTPYIPILTGVTFAFVLASLGFIALMININNPFAQVEEVRLPDLVGLKYDTILLDDQYKLFRVEAVSTDYSDEHGKGVVIDQDPKAGRTIKTGSVVKVTVSAGQKIVTLPNFAGKDSQQTFAKLRDDGLEYEEKRIFSDDVPIGSVIYTDPSKDSTLPSGTLVTVYVSMGPKEVVRTVPDVTGMTIDAARRMLELHKLKVGDITYESSDKPEDTVIAQEPAPGSLQPEDTPVSVVVCKGGSNGGNNANRQIITIPMPENYNMMVNVKAVVGDTTVAEEILNPSHNPEWNPPIPSGGESQVTVKIYVEDRIYMQYTVDFENGTFSQTRDYSDRF